MKTTDLIRHHIPQILESYGLPPVTGKRHYKGDCPLCGKRGKFRIDNKDGNGSWICTCGSGNIWNLLIEVTGKDFKTVANEIDQQFGNEYKAEAKTNPQQSSRMDAAMARVRASSKPRGTNVERYLQSRGIFELPERGVLVSGGNMYSIATDQLRNPVYSHETALEGDRKAETETQKRMLALVDTTEFLESVAIRMFDVASTLGIAEGIETALSCKQIYKCAMWSTLNSGFMKKFRAPGGVNHLMIFADNDNNGTGLAAAFECGNRNILSKNDVERVTIRWPGDVEDFNDMLNHGSQVYEWVLIK